MAAEESKIEKEGEELIFEKSFSKKNKNLSKDSY
jgi:hypothetical protein